jgi:hypothetical protein
MPPETRGLISQQLLFRRVKTEFGRKTKRDEQKLSYGAQIMEE